jgi:hypothetical protein
MEFFDVLLIVETGRDLPDALDRRKIRWSRQRWEKRLVLLTLVKAPPEMASG